MEVIQPLKEWDGSVIMAIQSEGPILNQNSPFDVGVCVVAVGLTTSRDPTICSMWIFIVAGYWGEKNFWSVILQRVRWRLNMENIISVWSTIPQIKYCKGG